MQVLQQRIDIAGSRLGRTVPHTGASNIFVDEATLRNSDAADGRALDTTLIHLLDVTPSSAVDELNQAQEAGLLRRTTGDREL